MWISGRVTMYDMLDQVCISVQVWSDPGTGEPLTEVLRAALTTSGVGEEDPSRWLRDALVALAETL